MRPKLPHRDHHGRTILVVDDDHGVRVLVERLLRGDGFRVVTAENGDGALDHVLKGGRPIDLLLTDIEMVGLDGHALAMAGARVHIGQADTASEAFPS